MCRREREHASLDSRCTELAGAMSLHASIYAWQIGTRRHCVQGAGCVHGRARRMRTPLDPLVALILLDDLAKLESQAGKVARASSGHERRILSSRVVRWRPRRRRRRRQRGRLSVGEGGAAVVLVAADGAVARALLGAELAACDGLAWRKHPRAAEIRVARAREPVHVARRAAQEASVGECVRGENERQNERQRRHRVEVDRRRALAWVQAELVL